MLALRSDPELLAAFGLDGNKARLDAIAREVGALAANRGARPSLALLYEVLARNVLDLDPLRVLLGRIVALALVEREPLPEGAYWDMLQSKIDTCRDRLGAQTADGSSASMIFETFARTPDGRLVYTLDDIFQKLLGDAFTLRLTTPAGPRAATWTQILPHAEPGAGGLCFRMKLDAARPPVTAPEGAEAPVLSIRAADSARICPVSIFERYRVTAIGFYVRAEGLTDVFAFSDAGPVATDQTFLPFGPRPVDGASFTIGASELARKPVTEIGLGLTWAALPGAGAGFGAQYRHYPDIDALPNPKLRVDYLGGEGWTALTEAPVPGQPVPAAAPVTPREFRSRQTMRAGAVRLTLSGTADGFHAGRYPLALVRAMRTQRLPFVQRPVPPEPFVPRAAGLTLSYAAADRIELNAPDTADPGERAVQVSPFGRVELFPRRTRPEVTLFPPRLGYGHLFIELDGPHATGPLALLFDIAASGHLRLVPDPNPIAWFYLTAAGWAALPATAVLSDSTAGLMRSGLVMIDLPEDAARNAPDMPGKGVWMAAVATRPGLDAFPALSMVATNGLRVIRAEDGTRPAPDGPARAWSFETPRPGLGAMREIALPAAIRPPETDRHYIARVSERLRHRKRAVTPWDMERMVPEEFPEV
ncbi:hypothetical protein [Rhodovulum marinum]|uniref:hypothetical protein n=1 Tax=Rhodovulum marinum TaxID=320662 RepID=UPI001404AAD6|nr:hypothetical protein [Rhodovulum marinum]